MHAYYTVFITFTKKKTLHLWRHFWVELAMDKKFWDLQVLPNRHFRGGDE